MEYETQIDETEIISKSQLKRDSLALQDLGKKLVSLSADQLAKVPLDEAVLDAIALAHRIQNKRSALKRHYQFLGKLLRARDSDPIYAALAEIEQQGQKSIQQHHRAESWRDRIVNEGETAINEFVEQTSQADRQKLRQLWRNLQRAGSEAKKTQHTRLIYKTVKAYLDH